MDGISQPSSKPHTYWHKDCRKQFTVTTKTCIHTAKRPTRHWVYAIYSVLNACQGVFAMQLSKNLGCQYRTAWHMLQRIREACGRGELSLNSVVEADKTYAGGREAHKHECKKLKAGRVPAGKSTVVGVRHRGGKVIAKSVEHADGPPLIELVESNVEPGSTIYTDVARAYSALPNAFNRFNHQTIKHLTGEYVRDDAHTNGVESVWAVLKRSSYRTWHHVYTKHLDRYVNGATFRLNEGSCEVDTIDRMEQLARGFAGKRLAFDRFIEPNGTSAIAVPMR